MKRIDVPEGDPLADEVKIHLDVLRTLVLDGVGGEVHGTHVVAVYDCRLVRRVSEFVKKLAKPARMGHCIDHHTVLCLRV